METSATNPIVLPAHDRSWCRNLLTTRSLLLLAIFAIVFDRFSLGPFSPSDLLLILAFLMWSLNVCFGAERVRSTKWLFLVGIIAASSLISILLGDDLVRSARFGFSLFAMCGMSVMIVNLIRDDRAIRTVLKCLMLAGILVSASALLQTFVFYTTGRFIFTEQLAYSEMAGLILIRPTGFYWDPNYLGLFLIIPLLAGLQLWKELGPPWRISLPLLLLTLLMTQSRGALLALGLVLGYSAACWFLTSWRRGRIRLHYLALAGLLMLATGFIGSVIMVRGFVSTSTITRMMIQLNALQLIAQRPLTGWGPGKEVTVDWIPALLQKAESMASGEMIEESGDLRPTHNFVLQTLLYLGMVGFAVLFGAIAYALRMVHRAAHGTSPPWLRALSVSFMGFLLTGLFLDGLLAKQMWVDLSLLVSGGLYLQRQTHSGGHVS